MYQLQLTLKQHTPIIHFQHGLKGATIRPTELKSKLDKFLIGKWTGCYGLDENQLNSLREKSEYWKFIKRGYDFNKDDINKNPTAPALDYDVEINVLKNENNKIDGLELQKEELGLKFDFELYFGNMGNTNPKKKMAFHSTILLKIKSTNKELLGIIEKNISQFLFQTNFGTRQNKGFGSFYLHNTKHSDIIDKNLFSQSNSYQFSVDVNGNSELDAQKKVFKYINLLYKTIRSGINRKGKGGVSIYYVKPTIWHYLKNNNYQWDKKTIKEKFYTTQLTSQQVEHNHIIDSPIHFLQTKPENEKYLWRDVLGLSTLQEWQGYPNKNIKDIHTRKVIEPIIHKNENREIKRFTSPILFKPLRKDKNTFIVFMLLDEGFAEEAKKEGVKNLDIFPSLEMFGKEVEINNSNNSINIFAPSVFDYKDFLKVSFQLSFDEIRLDGDDDYLDLKILKNILAQLNAQNPY